MFVCVKIKVIKVQNRGEYITKMAKKKIVNISDEMDLLLKEAIRILECTETSIIKNALLFYLRKILNDQK